MLKQNIFIFFIFIPYHTFCQPILSDDTFSDSASFNATRFYAQVIGNSARLYNGVAFKNYNLHDYDIGFPFFLSDDWLRGDITYDKQVFYDQYIMYDAVRDKVIIEHSYSHIEIELINEKIQRFSVSLKNAPGFDQTMKGEGEHTFVKLVPDSANEHVISTGFYELLYDGNVKVYAKRKKIIQTRLEMKTEVTEYIEKPRFFIHKNDTYFPVNNKRSMLKVFADRKTSVRKYLSKNKIKFAKNRGYALQKSAQFYDESEK